MVERAETPDVDSQPVVYGAGGALLFLVAVIGALAFAFPNVLSKPLPLAAAFPSPSVREDERQQRLQLKSEQRARLAGKTGGIPIEQAMDKIVARGTRAFDPIAEPAP